VFSVGRLKAVVLLIEFSVEGEILGLVRLDLGTAAFLVVGSAVVVVERGRLRNHSVLLNLLIFSLNLRISRSDLITVRWNGLVQSTVSLHGLILVTFFNDVQAEVSLGSVSEIGESLGFGLLNFRTSAASSASRNFSEHTMGLTISLSKLFLRHVVVGQTIGALDASEFVTHTRCSRRFLLLRLVLRSR